MKVLAIGDNGAHFARAVFGDEAQVDSSSLLPGKKRTDYDSVIGYMCLQQVPVSKVMDTVKAWVACLKQGGEFTIMVPSLEWAAVQVLIGDPSRVTQVHLFGGDRVVHRSGFTMMDLRTVCQLAGIAVTHAATNTYTIDGVEAEQHTVRGIKK